MTIRGFIGVALLVASLPLAQAAPNVEVVGEKNGWVHVRAEAQHTMSDGDSMQDARELALRKAKFAAAEHIGTYIETQSTIEGSQVTAELVTSYAAAFVTAKIIGEELSLVDGQPVVKIEMSGKIDRAALERKVKTLLEDPVKDRRIEALEAQNERLQWTLERVTQGRRVVTVSPGLKEASKGLDAAEALTKLDQLQNEIRREFQPGSLLAAAKADAERQEKTTEALSDQFWESLRVATSADIEGLTVVNNPDGTANVHVRLKWKTKDAYRFVWQLEDHFAVRGIEPGGTKPYPYEDFPFQGMALIPREAREHSAADLRLYDRAMEGRSLALEVSLGPLTKTVSIAGATYYDDFIEAVGQLKLRGYKKAMLFLFESPDAESAKTLDVQGSDVSEIVFERVPEAILAAAGEITTRVLLN